MVKELRFRSCLGAPKSSNSSPLEGVSSSKAAMTAEKAYSSELLEPTDGLFSEDVVLLMKEEMRLGVRFGRASAFSCDKDETTDGRGGRRTSGADR